MKAAKIEQLQSILDRYDSIVFLGGAGVSTESGVPDFRSAGGLYSKQWKYPVETMLSRSFFQQHPEEFFQFYRTALLGQDPQPNAAHRKLAQMEGAGKLDCIITQNIDGLHQKAGSGQVLELHGSIYRNYCQDCGKFFSADYIRRCSHVPLCGCGGTVKPDVVLYEEPLNAHIFEKSRKAVSKAQVLIVGGTSLVVYPAAGLLQDFRGQELVVINLQALEKCQASLIIHEPIGRVLDQIVLP